MVPLHQNDAETHNSTECSELLERILASAELKRAARLREFLQYVGSRSLEGNNVQVSEHEIGANVFGRPPTYDTSYDNIVRVNASELRKRIKAYFASEGRNEKLLLEIPLGSYTPVFRARAAEPVSQTERSEQPPDVKAPAIAAPQPVAKSPERRVLLYLVPVVVVLAAACLFLFQRDRAIQKALYGWKSEPALGSFWSGILGADRQTDIVVADTSVALIEDILKKQVSLSDYLNRVYLQQIQSAELAPDIKDDLQSIAARNNGSFGDFQVARRVLAFDPLSTRMRLKFAREYTPSDLRSDNVVLIGSSRSNPWVGLFQDRVNFTLEADPSLTGKLIVRSRQPQSGEQAIYGSLADATTSTGYGIVDYIANPGRTADVVIVAGTTSMATEAAGDFLTSEPPLRQFQQKLGVAKLPHFEALLRTTRLMGTPMSVDVVAYRLYPDTQTSH